MNWLADLVLVIHTLVVVFIVGGFIAIGIGACLRWKWIRNRRFRLIHLAAISFIASISAIGIACPLTILENWLRTGTASSQGFIQRWLGAFLYYHFPSWIFTFAYVTFALLVALAWRFIPPLKR